MMPDRVVSGNVYDKYGSNNPIVKMLMAGFFRAFSSLIVALPVREIVEVGCGEGEIGARLTELFPHSTYRGYDLSEEVVLEARRRYPTLSFGVLSVYDIPNNPPAADLVVASEVFEHLDDPERAMRALLSMKFTYLLVSVPREPVWRVLNMARGKYLSDLGNTPGHVNHWSKAGIIKFLGTFSRELEVVTIASPFPWTMVLLRRV